SIIFLELGRGWVDPDEGRAAFGIEAEEGAVVAADVEDDIVGARLGELSKHRDLFAEVLDHRAVQGRAIAVAFSVHFARIVDVAQLNEAATVCAVASDEFE